MRMLTIKRLRDNSFLRLVLKPFVLIKRRRDHSRYIKSEDSAYIRTLLDINNGKRCFIIGNGPSLTIEDINKLKGEITFACNRIYDCFTYTTWRPTYYICIDKDMLIEMQTNRTDMMGFAQSEVFCANKTLVRDWKKKLRIHEIFLDGGFSVHVNRRVIDSVSEDVSDHFSITQSSTCSMMEMAIYMGIKEIYLIGVDHNFGIEIDMQGNKVVNSGVQAHFKQQKDKTIYVGYKQSLTKCYEVFREYADTHGIAIKNATRGGKLEVFERVNLDSLF